MVVDSIYFFFCLFHGQQEWHCVFLFADFILNDILTWSGLPESFWKESVGLGHVFPHDDFFFFFFVFLKSEWKNINLNESKPVETSRRAAIF